MFLLKLHSFIASAKSPSEELSAKTNHGCEEFLWRKSFLICGAQMPCDAEPIDLCGEL